jgi:FlaG/FlaF family flagellin (archaellin)
VRRVLVVAVVASLASCGTTATKTVTRRVPAPSPTPVTTTATTPATGAVYFEGAGGDPQQRPSSLQLTADGTLFVAGVQWTSWGGSAATGSGNAEYHGCTPNCAQATPHTALVSIRLFGIRVCSGRQYYSGVTLRLNSGQLLDEQFLQRSWSPC